MSTNGTAARLDSDEVKLAMRGREAEILPAICPELGEAIEATGTKHVHCPFPDHDDKDPSFRIDNDNGCRAYCTCDAGKGDAIDLICRLRGCDFKGAMELIADYLGLVATTREVIRPSTFELVARAKNMPVESMVAYGAEAAKRGKVEVVRFPVRDESGECHSYFDLTPNHKGWFKKGKGKRE